MQVMARRVIPVTEYRSPFQVPRTLDEWLVTAVAVAWPLLFIFVIYPDMELNAFGQVIAWGAAFAVQCGILFALRNARRHA
jgi:hypothetical protein